MDNYNKTEKHKKEIREVLGLASKKPPAPPKKKTGNNIPPERFYTAQEEVTIRFYQVPKSLFDNPIYKGLSLAPKLMYSILRDRLDLSIKNNWEDEKGYIYLIFSVEELSTLLEAGVRSVIRYKKILVKYRLIIDKRVGQGKPNRVFVLKSEFPTSMKSHYSTS